MAAKARLKKRRTISVKALLWELQLILKKSLSTLVKIGFPFSRALLYFFSINYSNAVYREIRKIKSG